MDTVQVSCQSPNYVCTCHPVHCVGVDTSNGSDPYYLESLKRAAHEAHCRVVHADLTSMGATNHQARPDLNDAYFNWNGRDQSMYTP